MTQRVLVTGATGKVGSRVVSQLAGHEDVHVRALVRDPARAAALGEAGAELAAGSFEDAAALESALTGIDTLVLITPPGPHAIDQALRVLAAATGAGVRRTARLSVINAAEDGPTDNVRQHARADQAVEASGMAYTIVRPNYFLDNLFSAIPTILAEGNIYMAWGDARCGVIDSRDIADSIAGAVLADNFANQAVTLTGPQSLTGSDMAAGLTRILDRPVRYVPVSPEAIEATLRRMNLGDWFPTVMRDYSAAYARGWGDVVTDGVQRLSGHPARSFDDFAAQVFAPAFRDQARRAEER